MIEATLALLWFVLIGRFVIDRRRQRARADERAFDEEWRDFCAWFNACKREVDASKEKV